MNLNTLGSKSDTPPQCGHLSRENVWAPAGESRLPVASSYDTSEVACCGDSLRAPSTTLRGKPCARNPLNRGHKGNKLGDWPIRSVTGYVRQGCITLLCARPDRICRALIDCTATGDPGQPSQLEVPQDTVSRFVKAKRLQRQCIPHPLGHKLPPVPNSRLPGEFHGTTRSGKQCNTVAPASGFDKQAYLPQRRVRI